MKIYFYKTILLLYRVLKLVKKALFWLLELVWNLIEYLSDIIRKKLGFRFYKWKLRLGKWSEKFKFATDKGFVGFLGKRSTLQVIFLIAAVVVSIPHSKLYNKDIASIAGRETILYSIVGPGDENFEIEEIEMRSNPVTQITPKWRQGVVAAKKLSSASISINQRELNKFNIGGTAIMKPNIPPGTSIDRNYRTIATSSVKSDRKDIIEYTVKPGDVVGGIADRYGISVRTILWANDLSYNSYIRPGDTLKILPVSGVLHTVSPGDTLQGIANKYDAQVDKIMKYNELENQTINVGQELIVPDGEKTRTETQDETSEVQTTEVEENPVQQATSPSRSVNTPAGSGYIWPTTVHNITQYFGLRHTGLDIAGPRGTDILASKSGRVVRSSCGWNGGYGCYVVIDHGGGVRTLYAHNYRLYVSRGERVTQGDTVAAMGSTGRSTGPHTHFEVRIRGRRKNPLKYIR